MTNGDDGTSQSRRPARSTEVGSCFEATTSAWQLPAQLSGRRASCSAAPGCCFARPLSSSSSVEEPPLGGRRTGVTVRLTRAASKLKRRSASSDGGCGLPCGTTTRPVGPTRSSRAPATTPAVPSTHTMRVPALAFARLSICATASGRGARCAPEEACALVQYACATLAARGATTRTHGRYLAALRLRYFSCENAVFDSNVSEPSTSAAMISSPVTEPSALMRAIADGSSRCEPFSPRCRLSTRSSTLLFGPFLCAAVHGGVVVVVVARARTSAPRRTWKVAP
mmetsp:Transcript_22869/g.90700  ORF Transcript_22869/g.90700 Transcript_22869/m.90700 type:complete len:283 (+) Transcript_22869:427-1275(+)